MKKLFYSIALVCSLTLLASVASAQPKNSIEFRFTRYNYTYPLGSGFKVDDIYKANDGGGVEIGYYRTLFKRTYLAVPVKLGTIDLASPTTGFRRTQAVGNLDLMLQHQFTPYGKLINPYLQAGVGSSYNFDASEFAINFPVGIGLNIRLLDGIYLTAQTQYRFAGDDLYAGWQHGAGLHIFFEDAKEMAPPPPPADRDGDGINDETDKCPDEAGPKSTGGCPDKDGDGIADKDDACPTVKGTAAMKGCPDRDGDGITDADDKCPDQKGIAEFNGCPDTDKDGITDADDKCPRDAGPKATGGCPDKDNDGVADKDDACPDKPGDSMHKGCPDTDKDGVYDNEDRCVDKPGPATNKGCPELKKEDKQMVELAIRQVQFETGKAVLLQKSLPVLDNIADIMNRYPYYNLKISGHTDNVGDDAANQKLSEDRAKACFDYLVSKGIPAARMSHAGFGETKPVADNKTADGRAQNRRTEFDLILN